MKIQTKNDIRSKIRLIYGLTHVLKDDVDELRISANELSIANLISSLRDTNETLERIIDIIAEVEYTLYLERMKES